MRRHLSAFSVFLGPGGRCQGARRPVARAFTATLRRPAGSLGSQQFLDCGCYAGGVDADFGKLRAARTMGYEAVGRNTQSSRRRRGQVQLLGGLDDCGTESADHAVILHGDHRSAVGEDFRHHGPVDGSGEAGH